MASLRVRLEGGFFFEPCFGIEKATKGNVTVVVKKGGNISSKAQHL